MDNGKGICYCKWIMKPRSRPKIIHCYTDSYIQAYPKYGTPWCDVWIHWRDGARGRKVRLGPTFISLPDLKAEIRMNTEMIDRHPEFAEDINADINRDYRMLS